MTTILFLLIFILIGGTRIKLQIVRQYQSVFCKSIPTCFLFIFFISTFLFSYSQIPDSSLQLNSQFPGKYYSKVDKKISSVNDRLTKKSLQYLAKFQRQEQKLQRRLQKFHPELAITGATEKYNELSEKIKSKTSGLTKIVSTPYNPYLDSLGTSLNFLKQFNGTSEVTGPLNTLDQLQSKLQVSDEIKEFVTQRKTQVRDLLSKFHLPGSFKNQYDKFSKTAYYYSAQVKEYREMLKDPDKIEKKALSILSKLPAFQKFMKQNSQLASMFPQPDENNAIANLAGLQTRSSVQAVVQQRIASAGPNAMPQLQANLSEAHNEFNKLKDKLNSIGGAGSDPGMPDFKPNEQKTKPFLARLEYSADMQFEKSSKLLPSAANIGLGIGYKINDKSTAGIGLSYKLGMGTLRHISFTSQALGLRSYMDWKIKKQFYVTGGYEMNYNISFKNIEELKNYKAWQRSALIGASKKYRVSKKVKGEIKVLYDFLANSHIPVTQPFLFRFGYDF